MARYLLVQVDENDRAERLREKLDDVSGLQIIGIFGKPTQFCGCEESTDRSIKGKKYGWYVCPTCRAPKDDAMQHPINLMDSEVPSQYRNVFLTIREPYLSPMERTGPTAIFAKLLQIKTSAVKNARRKKRRPRARKMKG